MTNTFDSDTAVLVMAYSETEHYIPDVISTLDQFWPNRPETFIATDGRYCGSNTLAFQDVSFSQLLAQAVRALRQHRPKIRYVILMLEDLCPLDHVDEVALGNILATVQQRDIKYVSFPWYYAHLERFLDERSALSFEADGYVFSLIKKGSPFHCSVVTTIWEVAHLQWIADSKVSDGLHNPWSFESPVAGNQHLHYMIRGFWPVVADGFLHRGQLNDLIFTLRDWPDSPLLSHLRKEYCGIDKAWYARFSVQMKRLLALTGRVPKAAVRRGKRWAGRLLCRAGGQSD